MDNDVSSPQKHPKEQLAEKLKDANNVLVTVSTNPSVDQLAAAIGLTLFLSKMGKHATTVFSGEIPSTIDFLKPEETIEDNTDSLRDFIISLDKSKADKIRYKVEDTMVKIFITPYRTSINEQDLIFGQGDFNVDVVVGLGIHQREDIDQAIMAHGKILHDATVATINTKDGSELGTLNWTEPQASSLCEMAVTLTDALKQNSLDSQMATAFLTGVVAETERFSNDKTSSSTMNASAKLMAAGANQQLVATKLQEPEEPEGDEVSPNDNPDDDGPKDSTVGHDGSLHIAHESTIPENGDADDSPAAQDESSNSAQPFDELPEPVEQNVPEPENPQEETQIQEPSNEQLPELQLPDRDEPLDIKIDEHKRYLSDDPPSTTDETFGLPLPPTNGRKAMGSPHDQVVEEKRSRVEQEVSEKSALNLPSSQTPILSHDPKSSDEPVEGPEPEEKNEENNEAESSEPEFTTSQEPEVTPEPNDTPDIPLPQPQSEEPQLSPDFVKFGDTTLDDIEEQVDSIHKQPDEESVHQEATAQVAKAMATATLEEIEEKTGSPHMFDKQVAAATGLTSEDEDDEQDEQPADETETEDDTPQVLLAAETIKTDEEPALAYEMIDSEPPEAKADEETDKNAEDAPEEPSSSDENTAEPTQEETDNEPVAETTETEKPKDQDEEIVIEPTTQNAVAEELPDAEPEKVDEARDAISEAIQEGGDGNDSLPVLEQVGVLAADGSAPPVPPPADIQIDVHGNLSFPQNLVPNSSELPKDATAAPSNDASPPPVPPPMLPPTQ